MPPVAYYLATDDDFVDSNHALWHQPLPAKRGPGSLPSASAAVSITYGDYFSAVERFCASNGWDLPLQAASRKLARQVTLPELQGLSIFLEKHGAFYHPARLRVQIAGQTFSLVVNVAVSADGRQTLPHEVSALAQLNHQRPFGWLTHVYGNATVKLPGGGDVAMFMGDWFDGFHEFHLTRPIGTADPAIVVWNGSADTCLLSEGQTRDLYRNAAMIMTACYDPITTCQIFPWHHAAGDFVVSLVEERATVRLITVRDYVPILDLTGQPINERAVLEALLLFFVHLSICMRLDRFDGVGAVAWAPERCLEPAMNGFLQGLDLTARISGFPASFPELFRSYFNGHEMADLLPIADRLIDTVYDRRSEERNVIESNLDHHLRTLCRMLAT